MRLVPEYLTREQLLGILSDISQRVAAGDSFEGYLNYLLPDEGDDPDGFRVEARYRVGNLQGQGGMKIVGSLR